MDEATSHVDALTQDRLKKNLAALSCTQVVIAHRLSTIKDADCIVVLDGGRVVGADVHHVLISDRNGLYTRLVSLGAET